MCTLRPKQATAEDSIQLPPGFQVVTEVTGANTPITASSLPPTHACHFLQTDDPKFSAYHLSLRLRADVPGSATRMVPATATAK